MGAVNMEQRVYTLRPDQPDERDYVYAASSPSLPDTVDLRPHMSPIVNQGSLGSCTANAIVSGLREFLALKDAPAGQTLTRLSRLFLYWHERDLENTVSTDSGATLRDGMRVLANIGVPPEDDYPYMENIFTDAPSSEAEQHATANKITEYHRVMGFTDMQSALSSGLPVVIGMYVYPSFESTTTSGIVAAVDKTTETVLGGHALTVVGYKKIDNVDYAIVRNSWGTDWGDNGYCYVPRTYWDAGIVVDMWTGSLAPAYEKITFDQAVDILASHGILASPDFWHNLGAKYANDTTSDFRYLQLAFRRMAAYVNAQ
jgi:C1A family cysteine protease